MAKKRRNRRKAKWDEGGHWNCLCAGEFEKTQTFPAFEYVDPCFGIVRVNTPSQLRGLVRNMGEHWEASETETTRIISGAPRLSGSNEPGLPIFGYSDVIPEDDVPLLEEYLSSANITLNRWNPGE